jgi:putative transposase
MRKSKFTEAQIVSILKAQDGGKKVSDLCRKLGISEATFFRWKEKFGGMSVPEAKAQRHLEDENRELRQKLDDLVLDNQVLRHIVEEKVASVDERRAAVRVLMSNFNLSERRACELIGLQRSSWRYEPRKEPAKATTKRGAATSKRTATKASASRRSS